MFIALSRPLIHGPSTRSHSNELPSPGRPITSTTGYLGEGRMSASLGLGDYGSQMAVGEHFSKMIATD